jgi:P27 family predicted phage terminase small subunit
MQKLPKHRKQLTGTYRADKDRRGIRPGEALREAPPPPEGMSERACAAWEVLAGETVALNVLTSADLPMLALLAETQATAAELEATIRAEGFTIPTAAGGRKSHPALRALESTRNAAGRFLPHLGLSPSSRKFV